MSGYSFSAPPAPMGTAKEQVKVLYTYLYRMNENLNVALNSLSLSNLTQELAEKVEGTTERAEQKDALQSQYETLKGLVIKTADSVRQEMDVMETRLDGKYVAASEFGQYQEDTEALIKATADGIIQEYGFSSALEDLSNSAEEFDEYIVNTQQYIKTGLLYFDTDNVPRYGVAVGEKLTTTVVDGKTVLTRNDLCATFTSDRLSFWMGGAEVAYVSNNKLYIGEAQFTGGITMGDWRMSRVGGFKIQWIGA